MLKKLRHCFDTFDRINSINITLGVHLAAGAGHKFKCPRRLICAVNTDGRRALYRIRDHIDTRRARRRYVPICISSLSQVRVEHEIEDLSDTTGRGGAASHVFASPYGNTGGGRPWRARLLRRRYNLAANYH
ncbi:hypothetical protein EVAR_93108_1 [Eumeta japonica]|uniref:Uncharacterized protein n=1 Tax=Eumeta variegata TaxID=151549 RepID=A0A4C1TF63_EUMVA|nr:hypothetical protein EVAR_93108_1 [Eumeta japonica]